MNTAGRLISAPVRTISQWPTPFSSGERVRISGIGPALTQPSAVLRNWVA